jgi:hypothetical protein
MGDLDTWKYRQRDMETWRHWDIETLRHWDMDVETWTWTHQMEKMEARAIFLNPFTICSSCKRKFVFCRILDEETNRSYPFAERLQTKRTCPSVFISGK